MPIFHVNVSKINRVETFDTDKLPAQSTIYVTQYGFNKSINDAHAGVSRKDYAEGSAGEAEWLEAVEEAAYDRINQIRTGQVPRSAVVSPVLVEQAKRGLTDEQMLRAMQLLDAENAKLAKKSA